MKDCFGEFSPYNALACEDCEYVNLCMERSIQDNEEIYDYVFLVMMVLLFCLCIGIVFL